MLIDPSRTAESPRRPEAGFPLGFRPRPNPRQQIQIDADEAALRNPNVRALLETIPRFEGTARHGYNTRYGGERFDDLSTFPEYPRSTTSTASGRYQILRRNWESIGRNRLGLTDFSDRTQNLIAIELMRDAGILSQIERGDIEGAMYGAAGQWSSFPAGAGPLEHSRHNYPRGHPRAGQPQPSARYADVVAEYRRNVAAAEAPRWIFLRER